MTSFWSRDPVSTTRFVRHPEIGDDLTRSSKNIGKKNRLPSRRHLYEKEKGGREGEAESGSKFIHKKVHSSLHSLASFPFGVRCLRQWVTPDANRKRNVSDSPVSQETIMLSTMCEASNGGRENSKNQYPIIHSIWLV